MAYKRHFEVRHGRPVNGVRTAAGVGTMRRMPDVRRFEAGDAPAAVAIVRGLPDYFTDDVPAKVERDAADHEAWVITDAGTVAGFAVAARKSPGGAEILWIAIDAARRGRGLGTRLLGHVLEHLGADGVSVVEAKTLDRSSGYRPYEATRAFWERNGFVQVDVIDPLPGWQPGNPAAIYVAALRPTR
jgi:ribosomal protein S18 acetylase RimI-like enzyme